MKRNRWPAVEEANMQTASSWAKGVVMTGLGLALLVLDLGTASAGPKAATGGPASQQTLRGSESQSAMTAKIQRIDRVSREQIESILLDAAQRVGVAARPGTLVQASSPGFQVDALATHEAERCTLEDLGRGVDTHFMFLAQRRAGLAGGFYVQRLRIDDPQAPKAMKLEVLDLDGRTVGHAENVEVVLKILDGGPVHAEECTESWGPGVNSDGEECTNYAKVCTDSESPFVGGAAVEQYCIVWDVE